MKPTVTKAIFETFQRGFAPAPRILVSEWAEKNRRLTPKQTAEPGPWRNSRTPYLVGIMDALSVRSSYRHVVFQKASQVGSTEGGLNFIGYVMDHVPGPMMLVLPTVELAKRYSHNRVKQMIEACDSLSGKVTHVKNRNPDNTTLQKTFPGGFLHIIGSHSATDLASTPIKFLVLDEVDRYPSDVGGEGSPAELAIARTRTFSSRKKIFEQSTPTREGMSRIAKSFDATDQRYYYVPCPECEAMQVIRWESMKWQRGKPETVRMQCEACGVLISESHKTEMLEKGQWRATKAPVDEYTVGFHLNALYSPVGWYSWKEAVAEYEQARKEQDEQRMIVFTNTVLGLPYKDESDAPDWEVLYERREEYPIGQVPPGALFLTAAVDVQKNNLHVEIKAWGKDRENWSVDYRILDCATSEPKEFGRVLDPLLEEHFPMAHHPERSLQIALLAIDTGYQTQPVYAWARNKTSKVMCVKGEEKGISALIGSKLLDVNQDGRKYKKGIRIFNLGVNAIKEEVYGWLRLKKGEEGYPPGYAHFPQYGEDFFKGLTAERRTMKTVRGYPRYVWEKIRKYNEPLDLFVYNRAAAYLLGIDRMDDEDFEKLRSQVEEKPQKRETTEDKAVKTKGGIKVKKSSFW